MTGKDIFDAIREGGEVKEHPEEEISLAMDFTKGLKELSNRPQDSQFVDQVMLRVLPAPEGKVGLMSQILSWLPNCAAIAASILILGLESEPMSIDTGKFLTDATQDSFLFESATPDYSVLLNLKDRGDK
jgi:hypothetical protein